MKARVLTSFGVALLLLGTLVAAFLQPSQVDVARAKCREQGWRAEDLVLRRVGWQGAITKSGVVEFQTRGARPPKTIRVTLRQPVYFLGWQVVDYQEQEPD